MLCKKLIIWPTLILLISFFCVSVVYAINSVCYFDTDMLMFHFLPNQLRHKRGCEFASGNCLAYACCTTSAGRGAFRFRHPGCAPFHLVSRPSKISASNAVQLVCRPRQAQLGRKWNMSMSVSKWQTKLLAYNAETHKKQISNLSVVQIISFLHDIFRYFYFLPFPTERQALALPLFCNPVRIPYILLKNLR